MNKLNYLFSVIECRKTGLNVYLRSFDIIILLMMNIVQIVRSEIKDIQELQRFFQTKVRTDKVTVYHK
mgnify:FL=1